MNSAGSIGGGGSSVVVVIADPPPDIDSDSDNKFFDALVSNPLVLNVKLNIWFLNLIILI